ncbi:MAG TPA: flippase-like domain-containing protein [Acidimicrobiales bacterium]|nr:flippase-like domain-containing protein [Acidimicrobiales bacterium]
MTLLSSPSHTGQVKRGVRLFAGPIDEPRARRATDVVLAVAALAGLILLAWASEPPAGFEQALIDFLGAFPDFLTGVWQLLFDLFALWAIVLVAAAAVRRRRELVRDQLLAAVVALAAALILTRLVDGSWPSLWSALRDVGPPPTFPAARVACAAAVIITSSPHLSHPTRRIGRWLMNFGTASIVVLGAATPAGGISGLLVAVLAAAVVHLVFGSCGGRPGLHEVQIALDELGIRTSSLGAADRQPAGAFLVHGSDDAGEPLAIKVYGRDAYDTQLLAKLWRTVWYRQEGAPPTLSRLQQAEHEAFLSLLARQAGVPVQQVVTAGATADEDALLVLRIPGRALAELPRSEITDAVLDDLWRIVQVLHAADIAHGQIDPVHVTVEDGRAALVDFSASTVAPTVQQRLTDQAQVIVTSVVVAGEERGLAAARDVLGADGLTAVLAYLQAPALSSGLRRMVRGADLDLDELRTAAANLAGVQAPDLHQLRRVSWGALLQTALLLFAFFALVSAISGLDLADIADELRDASWWWIAVAAVFVQLPRVAQAVSTLGACPVPLPLGPVYALQLAISYVNLAIPSSAARIAVNIRFFQRQGVPPGSAVAVGAIDGFSGFVVQILLLGSILLFSNASLDLDFDLDTSGGLGRLLAALVVVAVLALAALLIVPAWRRALLGRARELLRQAGAALRNVRSPRRIAMLLGGNLAAELMFSASLGMMALALGYHVPFLELVLINESVALFAGLMPVPGGIGVTEGALTIGLTAAGVPQSAAFAIAVMYRLASFYLPPIWGWVAWRWLQRNKYL